LLSHTNPQDPWVSGCINSPSPILLLVVSPPSKVETRRLHIMDAYAKPISVLSTCKVRLVDSKLGTVRLVCKIPGPSRSIPLERTKRGENEARPGSSYCNSFANLNKQRAELLRNRADIESECLKLRSIIEESERELALWLTNSQTLPDKSRQLRDEFQPPDRSMTDRTYHPELRKTTHSSAVPSQERGLES
jgi:hypothetical protein